MGGRSWSVLRALAARMGYETLQLALILSVLLIGPVQAESDGKNVSKVLELTESNYDEVINNTPLILVEFYAPWCEYCQILEPKYELAAEELSLMDPPIPLARVNGDKEKNLYNRMGLNGYPTIFVFHNGRSFEYEGLRRTDSIVEFMKEEARPDWKPPEDHVLTLTHENFTESVFSSDLILVEFYAPWCGHCKRLAPEYARAAKELNLRHGIELAKVDATEETSLAKRFGVDGYPTLIIFRHGKQYAYGGPRDSKGIISYMVNQSISATQSFSTRKELDLFLANAVMTMIVAILPQGEDGDFWENYIELANHGRRTPIHFMHTSKVSLANGLGLSSDTGGLVMAMPARFISESQPAFTVLEYSLMENNMSRLMEKFEKIARPLVGLRSKENEFWWSFPMLSVYLAIDSTLDGKEDFRYWHNRLLPVAREFKGSIQVVMSDEVEYADELGELGLKDYGDDLVISLWASKKEKYIMKDEFDEDTLTNFVELFFEGRLRPVLKSQRKPKQKGPVKIVVGSTFDEIVFDQTKDVLIEFYAPWCGHCKNLEPKYKQLAKRFANFPDLVIAKFDATANDAPPEFEFKGFPTIFFVAAGELNNIIKYEGGREVEDFSSFLQEHAVHSLGWKHSADEL